MERIINIDHHISNDTFGTVVYIDDQASSTAELIYRLMLKMHIVMTKNIATNLYAAILTDTGGFCYGNTKMQTLFTAGKLVERGAEPQWISENIYESNSPVKLRLLKKVLESLAFDWDRKVGYMVVSRKDLENAEAREEDSEGFVEIPRSVKGVDVSILFTELSEHQYKLSFRSKGKVNIEPVAKAFGGGGHMNAAACQINGHFNTALHQVLSAIKDLAIAS
jgi:phosphoesterase RecJ-like protein